MPKDQAARSQWCGTRVNMTGVRECMQKKPGVTGPREESWEREVVCVTDLDTSVRRSSCEADAAADRSKTGRSHGGLREARVASAASRAAAEVCDGGNAASLSTRRALQSEEAKDTACHSTLPLTLTASSLRGAHTIPAPGAGGPRSRQVLAWRHSAAGLHTRPLLARWGRPPWLPSGRGEAAERRR